MNEINIISNVKKLNAFINKVVKQSANLRDAVHQAAVSAAVHALEHGNTTPLNNLIVGLSNDRKTVIRTNELRQWLLDNCPWLTWGKRKREDGTTSDLFLMDTEGRDALLPVYEADKIGFIKPIWDNPFYVKIKEAKFVPFNFDKKLAQFIAQAKTRKAKNLEGDDFKHFDAFMKAIDAADGIVL